MGKQAKQKRQGRPVAGRDAKGKPIPVSDYPRIQVHIAPRAKEQLDALSTVLREPPRVILERAIDAYAARLPAEHRRAILNLMKTWEK